jgi:Metallo-peptidase family M12B Reprolysin-like
MTENIGIREQWIEKGWTEQQMLDRIAEIEKDSPKPWCQLQPYVLNYLQSPDLNQRVLDNMENAYAYASDGDGDDNNNNDPSYWIAASNLWTPGQPLTISFTPASPANMVATVKKYLMADLQPYVSMKISFVDSGGMVVVNIVGMSGVGGNSAVGHTQTGQIVNLNTSSMNDNVGAKFNQARYLVLHEFGHCMGLWHEWNREMCGSNGVTCSGTQDSYSVMNYPA